LFLGLVTVEREKGRNPGGEFHGPGKPRSDVSQLNEGLTGGAPGKGTIFWRG